MSFRFASLALALALALASASVGAIAKAEAPVVVCRTEYVSVSDLKDSKTGRLLRELGRQALLIAARDELGAVTRDETLGEVDRIDDQESIVSLMPRVRSRWPGLTEMLLEKASDDGAVGESIKAYDGKFDITSVYPTLAAAWEEASRTTLKQRLSKLGVEGEVRGMNAENVPAEEVESLLGRMNFVSQWDAISRAHQAIAQQGPSVEWLSVLARGYAHLGTLIDHHWTGAPEAFFARAMLYAERARSLAPEDPSAKWLRPYVLATCGAHGAALKQTELLQPAESELPPWARLVEPISNFDVVGLKRLAKTEESLGSLALWSAVCLERTLGSHASFYKIAMESLKSDPDAYGAYSDLVTLYASLGDQRYGAAAGPLSLGKNLFQRLGDVADLPEPLRKDLPASDDELLKLVQRLKDNYDGDSFLPTPNLLVDHLRQADAAAEAPREPSWTSLASLVAEEQFVMAVNYCTSMQNATETDLTEPIAALAQLVEGHRYAPYIRSCALPPTASVEQINEVLGGVEIKDPRHNMWPMLVKAIKLPKPEGKRLNIGHDASWEALWSYDYRLPSLVEEYRHAFDVWSRTLKPSDRAWMVKAYREVSPAAPHWLRSTMREVSKPTPAQLDEWSEPARKDDVTARHMAHYYESAGQVAKAAEWLETSYELEPEAGTAIQLAKLYRSQDQEERWLPTLKRYLDEQENRGLEHSGVQAYIAETLMHEDRDFAAALPYAEQAAETYSARSLAIALEANEGMARWEEADHFAQALSTSYPSSSGDAWYLFRRRTGHGDPEEAKPLLEYAFAADKRGRKFWTKLNYVYIEGELEAAFEAFHNAGVNLNQIYSYRMAALIATELGDTERVAEEIATVRGLANKYYKEKDPAQCEVNHAFADLLEKGEMGLDAEALQARLQATPPEDRRYLQMSLGAAMQVLGIESDLSDELLYEAAATPKFDTLAGNLAGHFLVRKYGRVRTDPVEPPGEDAGE
jgi:hypothetical protein